MINLSLAHAGGGHVAATVVGEESQGIHVIAQTLLF